MQIKADFCKANIDGNYVTIGKEIAVYRAPGWEKLRFFFYDAQQCEHSLFTMDEYDFKFGFLYFHSEMFDGEWRYNNCREDGEWLPAREHMERYTKSEIARHIKWTSMEYDISDDVLSIIAKHAEILIGHWGRSWVREREKWHKQEQTTATKGAEND